MKDRYEKEGWIKIADRCYVLPDMPEIWEAPKDNLDYKKLSKENEEYFKEKKMPIKTTTLSMNCKGHHVVITQTPDGNAKYVIFKGEKTIIVNDTDHIVSVGKINNVPKEILGENDLQQLVYHFINKSTKGVVE